MDSLKVSLCPWHGHTHCLVALVAVTIWSLSSSLSELIVMTLTAGLGVSAITIVCWRCSLWVRFADDMGLWWMVFGQLETRRVSSLGMPMSSSGGVFSFTRFFTGESWVEVISFVDLYRMTYEMLYIKMLGSHYSTNCNHFEFQIFWLPSVKYTWMTVLHGVWYTSCWWAFTNMLYFYMWVNVRQLSLSLYLPSYLCLVWRFVVWVGAREPSPYELGNIPRFHCWDPEPWQKLPTQLWFNKKKKEHYIMVFWPQFRVTTFWWMAISQILNTTLWCSDHITRAYLLTNGNQWDTEHYIMVFWPQLRGSTFWWMAITKIPNTKLWWLDHSYRVTSGALLLIPHCPYHLH